MCSSIDDYEIQAGLSANDEITFAIRISLDHFTVRLVKRLAL